MADKSLEMLLRAIIQVRDKLEDVSISNLDEVKAHLRNELALSNKSIIASMPEPPPEFRIDFPKSFDINNLDGLVPDFPEKLEVSNLGELQGYFDSLADVIRSSLKVDVQVPEINIPKPEVTVNTEPPVVNVPGLDLSEMLEALKPLKLITNKAGKPISVRLSDGNKFIKELVKIAKSQEKQTQAFSQAAGMTNKQYMAAERALTQKNTATNTKVTVGSTSTSVITETVGRISLSLVNDSNEIIYISKSGTAVMNEGIRLNSEGGALNFNDYTGAVSAICNSGSKNLTVCEV